MMGPEGLNSWLSSGLKPGWSTAGIAIGLVALWRAYLRSGPLAQLKALTSKSLPEGRPFQGSLPEGRPFQGSLPEGRPFQGYSPTQIEEFLTPPPPSGNSLAGPADIWGLYRRALARDIPFAVIITAGLVVVLDGTLGAAFAKPSLYSKLLLIPVGAGLVDILEDLLLLRATRDHTVSKWVTKIANIVTYLKWGLVTLSLGLAVLGALLLAIKGANAWTPPPAHLIFLSLGLLVYHPILLFVLRDRSPGTEDPAIRAQRAFRLRIFSSFANLTLAAAVFAVFDWCPQSLESRCVGKGDLLSALLEGLLWGGLITAFIACLLGIAVTRPSAAAKLRDVRHEGFDIGGLFLRAGLILVGTALPEEILFRGVLFVGWRAGGYDPATAIVMTSLAFGLWHIAPELERLRENKEGNTPRKEDAAQTGGPGGAIAFTTFAGVGFGILRKASGSIWPGVVAHAGANISGMVAAWIVGRRTPPNAESTVSQPEQSAP